MFSKFKEKFNILKEGIILPDIPNFYISVQDIREVLKFLKDSPEYYFKRLDCIEGKDGEITYILHSDCYNIKCAVTTLIETGQTVSVCDIYKSANFDEREIYDLFGIIFLNHPNLQRILLPESFIGHPLKKDYKMSDERLRWNYE